MTEEKHSESQDSAEMWAEEAYHFHGQRQGERVMMVRRQHPIVLLPIIFYSVLTLILPYLLIRFAGGSFRLYSLVIYFIILAWYVGHHVYAYFNTVSILSNQRIIQVLQKGFFNANISEAELSRIQDVSSDIKGVLETAFGYGDVTIRTASKDSLLILKKIVDPYDVQQAIVRTLKEQ